MTQTLLLILFGFGMGILVGTPAARAPWSRRGDGRPHPAAVAATARGVGAR